MAYLSVAPSGVGGPEGGAVAARAVEAVGAVVGRQAALGRRYGGHHFVGRVHGVLVMQVQGRRHGWGARQHLNKGPQSLAKFLQARKCLKKS